MTDEQQTDDLYELVRRVKAKMSLLELVSHGKTGAYDSDGGRGAPDSKPPGGGVGKADDFQIDFPQKSHLAFRATYAQVVKDLQALDVKIAEAVKAWKQTPRRDEPEFGTFEWKRWVGETDQSDGEIARKYSCSRQYVNRIRHEYGA